VELFASAARDLVHFCTNITLSRVGLRAGRKIASVSLSGEAAILVSIERRGSALASRTVTFYVSGHRRSPAAALPVFPSSVVLWRRIEAGFNTTFIIVSACIRSI
jgi:hypothetical protein